SRDRRCRRGCVDGPGTGDGSARAGTGPRRREEGRDCRDLATVSHEGWSRPSSESKCAWGPPPPTIGTAVLVVNQNPAIFDELLGRLARVSPEGAPGPLPSHRLRPWRRLSVRLAALFALVTLLAVGLVGGLVYERQKREVEDT